MEVPVARWLASFEYAPTSHVRRGRDSVSDLIAIGYPDKTTALKAEKEAQRLASELIIEPDAIAAIVRDKDGKFRVTTNHHPVGGGASYGMFWGLLFGL